MSSKYAYLKQYINNEKGRAPRNLFLPVDNGEILESEDRLGFKFPLSLKEFWREVGYGFLKCTDPTIAKSTFDHNNRITPPSDIADILLLKEESGLILPEAVEYIDDGYIGDGDIIFFEIADMSSFLVMKSKSDKSNAIYNMIGEIIEEDFERFIWRLYYESPTYYLNANK